MTDVDVLQRSLARERKARKTAEKLLDDKSRLLYRTNEELNTAAIRIRQEAAMTEMILQTAAEGIITFGEDAKIRSANPAAEQIFGYAEGELHDASIVELLPTGEETTAITHITPMDEHFWTSAERVAARRTYGRKKEGVIFEMELAGSRAQLEDTLLYTWIVRDITDRGNLERQLALAQKLESVGQLAAGVAHEINTPIQFVGDNLTFLKNAFGKWDSLMQLYEQLYLDCISGNDTADICEQIARKAKRVQLGFLREEFPAAIEQSSEGTQRVAKIVRAMKEFSHPGTHQKTEIDLNQAIESTATVSRNEWKYVAKLDMDLDPNLPPVSCYPAELNQAILNLVVNGAHAIAERGNGEDGNDLGTITLTTEQFEQHVEIRVSDTGSGIPDSVRDRIFEPFFTTKPVGKGTGQGLSIAYSVIVEKHGGTIDIESQRDVGTTFIIRLPFQSENSKAKSKNADTNLIC